MDENAAKRFGQLVEAAYGPDPDDARWLGRLLEQAAPLLDDGLGLIAYRADRAPGGGVTIGRPARTDPHGRQATWVTWMEVEDRARPGSVEPSRRTSRAPR